MADRMCCACCVFIMLCVVFPNMAAAADSAVTIKYAQNILNKGWYVEALKRFHEVAEESEDDTIRSQALFYIAQTHGFYLRQHDIALDYYDELVLSYPNSPAASDALFNSAIIHFDKGNYQTSHSLFTCYMEQYPESIRLDAAAAWVGIVEPFLVKPATKILQEPIRPIIRKPDPPEIKHWEKSDAEESTIRVLLREKERQIRIRSLKTIVVSDAKSEKLLYSGWGPLVFSAKAHRLYLNGRAIESDHCRISSEVTAMRLDQRDYRGCFMVSATADRVSVVNHIDVESYLYSVVPSEMPGNWPRQALMAQAVAARTYALYMKEKNAVSAYDLEATTASQVYGGYAMEIESANRAVDATRGQVMTHKGRLIVACFHSSSGGHTEDPRNVWNARLPYLRGIPDQFSKDAQNDKWEYFLTFKDIKQRLKRYGINVGRVEKIKAEGKSPSGRHLKVLVVSDKGVVPFSSSNFRSTVGETKLKSTMFSMIPHSDGILFKGRGYGHGVGMSQQGACKMARKGANYIEILRYYYQGIQIVPLPCMTVETAGKHPPLT